MASPETLLAVDLMASIQRSVVPQDRAQQQYM
jgi:hypothetical protein